MFDTTDGEKATVLKSVNVSYQDNTSAQQVFVEVVRCKDCVYRYTTFCEMSITLDALLGYREWTKDEKYCSRGKKKV